MSPYRSPARVRKTFVEIDWTYLLAGLALGLGQWLTTGLLHAALALASLMCVSSVQDRRGARNGSKWNEGRPGHNQGTGPR